MQDVPSPIDFRSEVDAREWAAEAMAKRPWRTEFFARMADELAAFGARPLSILDLGSGPGFLARHLLTTFATATYVALDFSSPMHALATERLGPLRSRVTFVERDFRDAEWTAGLSNFDAVVTMQAVHELRHKRHAPSFYRDVRALVPPFGMLLVCDHFVGAGGMTDNDLYMTPDEHKAAIREAGFSSVEVLMLKGGLALFRAGGSK